MRHKVRLATTIAVSLLSVGVVAAADERRLVLASGGADLHAARLLTAVVGAIPVTVITRATDRECGSTSSTRTNAELHPPPPTDGISTSGGTSIIVFYETTRLHPRGDSVAAESPVSSTGTTKLTDARSHRQFPAGARARGDRQPAFPDERSQSSATTSRRRRCSTDSFTTRTH
jgi:hypothetical protein